MFLRHIVFFFCFLKILCFIMVELGHTVPHPKPESLLFFSVKSKQRPSYIFPIDNKRDMRWIRIMEAQGYAFGEWGFKKSSQKLFELSDNNEYAMDLFCMRYYINISQKNQEEILRLAREEENPWAMQIAAEGYAGGKYGFKKNKWCLYELCNQGNEYARDFIHQHRYIYLQSLEREILLRLRVLHDFDWVQARIALGYACGRHGFTPSFKKLEEEYKKGNDYAKGLLFIGLSSGIGTIKINIQTLLVYAGQGDIEAQELFIKCYREGVDPHFPPQHETFQEELIRKWKICTIESKSQIAEDKLTESYSTYNTRPLYFLIRGFAQGKGDVQQDLLKLLVYANGGNSFARPKFYARYNDLYSDRLYSAFCKDRGLMKFLLDKWHGEQGAFIRVDITREKLRENIMLVKAFASKGDRMAQRLFIDIYPRYKDFFPIAGNFLAGLEESWRVSTEREIEQQMLAICCPNMQDLLNKLRSLEGWRLEDYEKPQDQIIQGASPDIKAILLKGPTEGEEYLWYKLIKSLKLAKNVREKLLQGLAEGNEIISQNLIRLLTYAKRGHLAAQVLFLKSCKKRYAPPTCFLDMQGFPLDMGVKSIVFNKDTLLINHFMKEWNIRKYHLQDRYCLNFFQPVEVEDCSLEDEMQSSISLVQAFASQGDELAQSFFFDVCLIYNGLYQFTEFGFQRALRNRWSGMNEAIIEQELQEGDKKQNILAQGFAFGNNKIAKNPLRLLRIARAGNKKAQDFFLTQYGQYTKFITYASIAPKIPLFCQMERGLLKKDAQLIEECEKFWSREGEERTPETLDKLILYVQSMANKGDEMAQAFLRDIAIQFPEKLEETFMASLESQWKVKNRRKIEEELEDIYEKDEKAQELLLYGFAQGKGIIRKNLVKLLIYANSGSNIAQVLFLDIYQRDFETQEIKERNTLLIRRLKNKWINPVDRQGVIHSHEIRKQISRVLKYASLGDELAQKFFRYIYEEYKSYYPFPKGTMDALEVKWEVGKAIIDVIEEGSSCDVKRIQKYLKRKGLIGSQTHIQKILKFYTRKTR